MKSVLMLVENNPVPFDKRVWREALTLAKHGFTVRIISPKDPHHRASYQKIAGIEIFRYNVRFSNGSALGFFREYAKSFFATLAIACKIFLRKGGFQVIHSANPPDLYCLIAFPFKLFRVKYIFDEHDLSPELYLSKYSKNKNFTYKMLLLFQRLSYRIADAVISTNQSYKKAALERGGLAPEKVFVVRNGPDTRSFKATRANKKWREGRRYLVAYIGIMAAQDGVEYLVRACHHIVHELGMEDISFALIGKGEELERLKKLANKLGVGRFISFKGRMPDEKAIEILSTADVCVDPDPHNPLNNLSTMNKIMEYMACEAPIVSFKLKEARISAREAAIYVRSNSAKALAKGIIKLIDNPQLRKKMARFGRQRVERELCWQKQEDKLIEVYNYLKG